MNKTPQWLFELVQKARTVWGVNGADWHICTAVTDKPGGSADNDGSAKVDYKYLNANLEFNDRLLPDDSRSAEIALHEVGHVAMGELDSVVEEILNGIVDEGQTEVYRRLYRDAAERFLQRASRAMAYYHFGDWVRKGGETCQGEG